MLPLWTPTVPWPAAGWWVADCAMAKLIPATNVAAAKVSVFIAKSFDVRMRIHANPQADRAFVGTNPASGVLFLQDLSSPAGRHLTKSAKQTLFFRLAKSPCGFTIANADPNRSRTSRRTFLQHGSPSDPGCFVVPCLAQSINEDCGLLAQLGVMNGAPLGPTSHSRNRECEVFRFQFTRQVAGDRLSREGDGSNRNIAGKRTGTVA